MAVIHGLLFIENIITVCQGTILSGFFNILYSSCDGDVGDALSQQMSQLLNEAGEREVYAVSIDPQAEGQL